MNKARNELLNELKYEEGEASQKKVAEEAIKRQLFCRLCNLHLENGESTDLDEAVEQIADSLGLQANKKQIAQYITQLLQSGNYQYGIDTKGNIEAKYSRLYMLQEEAGEKSREEMHDILQGFVERTELYASELKQQNIKVTETNLRNKFSEREQEQESICITLAVEKVLEMQSQEK